MEDISKNRAGSTEEIARVLDGYADAWKVGDLGRILAAYHDDFVLHYFGESPLAGSHSGKPSAMAVLAEATRRSGRRLVAIEDRLVGSSLGALVVVESAGADDDRREIRRVLLYRVADGRLREAWLFDEDQRFVDRLWSAS